MAARAWTPSLCMQLCQPEPCDRKAVLTTPTPGQHLRQLSFPKCLEKPTPLCGLTKIKSSEETDLASGICPLLLPSQVSWCLSQLHFPPTCCQAWCPGEKRAPGRRRDPENHNLQAVMGPCGSYQWRQNREDGHTV